MLVVITLGIMLFLSVLSLVLGSSFASYSTTILIDNEAIINGSSATYFSDETINYIINMNTLAGQMTFLTIIVIGIAVAVGITILGSGISASNAKIIVMITAYVGIWTILTGLSGALIISIEIYGTVIYICLTIVYIIGVLQQISKWIKNDNGNNNDVFNLFYDIFLLVFKRLFDNSCSVFNVFNNWINRINIKLLWHCF